MVGSQRAPNFMNPGKRGRADSREVILSRIRAALADAPPRRDIPRNYERSLPAPMDIVELFVSRVEDYRATVHRTSPEAIARAVADVLAAWGAKRVVVPAGVPTDWLATSAVQAVGDDPPLAKAVLDGLDGVVTGCAAAIAETGTIVLDAGPDQGRRVLSLLPDHHLCVVREDQIVGSVPEALARLDARRPLTWISGPSATSDIELERVEGVHGPRHLDVLVVTAPGGSPA
jgi:L-lactate dehydrogenase complex protein LldG